MSRTEVVVAIIENNSQWIESIPLLKRFYGLSNLIFENAEGRRISYDYNVDVKDFLQYFPVRVVLVLGS